MVSWFFCLSNFKRMKRVLHFRRESVVFPKTNGKFTLQKWAQLLPLKRKGKEMSVFQPTIPFCQMLWNCYFQRFCVSLVFFLEKSHKLNPKRKVTRPPQPYKTPYPPLNSSSKAAAEHLDGLVRLELAEVENPRNCRPDLLVEGLVGKISSQRKDVCLFFLVKENSWLGWLIVIVEGGDIFSNLFFVPSRSTFTW